MPSGTGASLSWDKYRNFGSSKPSCQKVSSMMTAATSPIVAGFSMNSSSWAPNHTSGRAPARDRGAGPAGPAASGGNLAGGRIHGEKSAAGRSPRRAPVHPGELRHDHRRPRAGHPELDEG